MCTGCTSTGCGRPWSNRTSAPTRAGVIRRDRIKRTRAGTFRLRLPDDERQLLRSLPGQLRALIGTDDPSLRLLFPPAYAGQEHAEFEAEYRRFMNADLEARHVR